MKRILQKLMLASGAMALLGGFVAVAAPVGVSAQINEAVCDGVNLVDDSNTEGCNEATGSGNTFADLMKRIINIFSMVVGAVSVVMIIIGGFRYIVSNGDSNGVSGAKNTILYAIIGLIVVLFAQIIVRFVLTNATK